MQLRLRNGTLAEDTEAVAEECIDIMAEDGRILLSIRKTPDFDENGALELTTGMTVVRVKPGGKLLDSSLAVFPQGAGTIVVARPDYK